MVGSSPIIPCFACGASKIVVHLCGEWLALENLALWQQLQHCPAKRLSSKRIFRRGENWREPFALEALLLSERCPPMAPG